MSDKELTPPPAPSVKGSASSAVSSSSEGDWTCSDCSNVNFYWRTACNRCSKARTPVLQRKKKLGQEIGKQAAEKSRGLFSADDWQCNKCGNVNWARRVQCNVCNAPKFAEVEERTGFGGGYNDRGVVEYKEREDSDDDYDEFGRRKKKRGDNGYKSDDVSSSNSRDVEEKPKVVEEEAEEEDEDGDEDDGDLSKYDLSDWGDVGSTQDEQGKHKKRDKSRSRTRSRSPIDRK